MTDTLFLPAYPTVVSALATLSIPISASELHGLLCGYLVTGAQEQAENYLRSLSHSQRKGVQRKNARRAASVLLFEIYTVSQYQITQFGFDIQLLLPDDDASLYARTLAFREWCEGFTQGVTLSGALSYHLNHEETEEALEHLTAFAELDLQELTISEEDERALCEITEYARLAVLSIYNDLHQKKYKKKGKVTH